MTLSILFDLRQSVKMFPVIIYFRLDAIKLVAVQKTARLFPNEAC